MLPWDEEGLSSFERCQIHLLRAAGTSPAGATFHSAAMQHSTNDSNAQKEDAFNEKKNLGTANEKTHVSEDRSREDGDASHLKVDEENELAGAARASNDMKAEKAASLNEAKEKDVTTTDINGAPIDDEEPEDESKYLSGLKLWTLSFGLCLTTFVIALDNTIIATAIPKITSVFNSLEDVGWYGSSYLLTTTSLQPSFGKVYTYFDVKYTYLIALVIFEVGSVICAAATTSPMFIIGRAIAGAGAAALYSGGMTIIGFSVPLRKRAIYIAALSSMFGIASVVGPILGGAFTDRLSWRCMSPTCLSL